MEHLQFFYIAYKITFDYQIACWVDDVVEEVV